jgi:hypothetical protein
MDDCMSDDIDEMSKDDLAAYAELHGIEIDGRWSGARIREAIREKIGGGNDGAPEVEISSPPEGAVIASAPGEYNLDAMVSEWADGWANRVIRAFATFEGNAFTVTLDTANGRTVVTIDNVGDNATAVAAALDLARDKMLNGE